jgi:hypothetical protein
MNQAARVGGGQAAGRFAGNLHRFGDRQRARAGRPLGVAQPFFERLPAQQLHREIRNAALFADLINVDDALVVKRCHGPGFPQKTLARFGMAGDRRLQRLEGDLTFELRILGQKDDSHAAGAKDPEQAIMPEPAQLVRRLRRREQRGNRRPWVVGHVLGCDTRRSHMQRRRQSRQASDQCLDGNLVERGLRRRLGARRRNQSIVRRQSMDRCRALIALFQMACQRLGVRVRKMSAYQEFQRFFVGTRHALAALRRSRDRGRLERICARRAKPCKKNEMSKLTHKKCRLPLARRRQ